MMKSDGTWIYAPSETTTNIDDEKCCVDSIAYEIFDHGHITGATLDFTIHGIESQSVMAEQPTADASLPSSQPLQLLLRTTTHSTILFNPHDAIGSKQPTTVIIEQSPDGTSVVNSDGSIAFTPNADFVGETILEALVEGPGGAAQFVTVNIDVRPPVTIRNSLKSTAPPNRSLPKGCSTTFRVVARCAEPQFDGTARPGSQVVATAFDAAAQGVARTATVADASGRWELQLPGLSRNTRYLVHFSEPSGSSAEYGYLTVNPPGTDYDRVDASGADIP